VSHIHTTHHSIRLHVYAWDYRGGIDFGSGAWTRVQICDDDDDDGFILSLEENEH
jgi:hypothetical protein